MPASTVSIYVSNASHNTYMELSLELSITSELDEHHLVKKESYKIEGFRNMMGFLSGVGHGCDGLWKL